MWCRLRQKGDDKMSSNKICSSSEEINFPFETKKGLYLRILDKLCKEGFRSCQTCVYNHTYNSSMCDFCGCSGKSWEPNETLNDWAFKDACWEIESEYIFNSIENEDWSKRYFSVTDFSKIIKEKLKKSDALEPCRLCEFNPISNTMEPCNICHGDGSKFALKKEFQNPALMRLIVESVKDAVKYEVEKNWGNNVL